MHPTNKMPYSAKKFPPGFRKPEFPGKQKIQKEYPIECILRGKTDADFCATEIDAWESDFDELLNVLQTGEITDDFREVTAETWDSAPDLRVNVYSEVEFDRLPISKEYLYSLHDDWDSDFTSTFEYSVWKWGKVRIIMSGFSDYYERIQRKYRDYKNPE